MSDLDSLPWYPDDERMPNGAKGRKPCKRHQWTVDGLSEITFDGTPICARCGKQRDDSSRRGRTARKRGISDELEVARILGGRKVGPMGWPWDVEVEGYLRAQSKKLARWPSLSQVIAWLDAIPASPELRAVTLADAPGPGRRTRRLIVLDLDEFARWHGR